MAFVSLTRLRIRSIRFMPMFALYTLRSVRQVRKASGFQVGALLPDRHRAFWTMTAWNSQDDMRRYMTAGPHKQAMPRLLHWCDEASVAHWDQADNTLPSWAEADQHMRASGRASKVKHPCRAHATLTYAAPHASATVHTFSPVS